MKYLLRNVKGLPCRHCGAVLEFFTSGDGLCLVPDGGHALTVYEIDPGYPVPDPNDIIVCVPLDERPELAHKPMVVHRLGFEQVA